jgi:hypothetical protein
VSATASSGLPVSFAASGSCTISGNTVTIVTTGSCTITASQGGNVNFNPAPDVPRTFNITNAGPAVNVAAAANGATAAASSTYGSGYEASGAINGDRKGQPWGGGGGWNDGTPGTWPDWLAVTFNGTKTIAEVDVFSVQDNYGSPVEPTAAMTFTLYGLTDFAVEFWDGATWQPVPGAVVSGNNLVWRRLTFAPVTTTKIRVMVTNALNTWSRMTEVEAYQSAGNNVPPTVTLTSPADGATATAPATIGLAATAGDSDGTVKRVDFYANGTIVGTANTSPYQATWSNVAAGSYSVTAVAIDNLDLSTTSAVAHITVNASATQVNVASAANGATAAASSTHDSGYDPSGAINGDRKGLSWGNGGGWNDGTAGTWPDWLEVTFNGTKTITEVDVFSVQDNYASPVDPTAAMTFTSYGLTDFTVEYWNGTAWQTVPGGVVTGNTLVWRRLTFAPVTATKIRVTVTNALATWSRITEVEAWTQ